MSIIVGLIALTLLLGPVGAIPFAFAQGMSALETAIVVSLIHAALVPFWFWFFEFIGYGLRYENRLIFNLTKYAGSKVKRVGPDLRSKIQEFEWRVGQRGFGLGVIGFTFLFGVFWAALAAFLLNIKKTTIITSVTIGAVASSIFWTIAFAGVMGFLPSPWVLYLVGFGVTFAIIAHKKIYERELIQEMSRSLRKLGVKMR